MQLRTLQSHCFRFAAVIRLLLAAGLTMLIISSTHASEIRGIRLVVSSENSFASDTANQLQRIIEQEMPAIAIDKVSASAIPKTISPPTRVLVTIGDSAWRAVMASGIRDTAIIAVIPQRNSYEVLSKPGSRNTSAIYLDQPLGRWFNLISLLKPDKARVGVLLGAETNRLSQPMLVAAAERKLQLFIGSVNGEAEVGRVLNGVVRYIDVLLAIPDSIVHTSNTVQSILLMSYQAGVPVVGYSTSYQRAGAMLVLYSTPEQIAKQAAEVVASYLDGKPIPVAQDAKYFSIGINATVARSLGQAFPDNVLIEQKLRMMKE